jgi:hypothetical protein
MSNEINPGKKRGCLFYGCLSLVIAALLVIVVGILGYFFLKRTTEGWVRNYTDAGPAQLERVEYSREQTDVLQRKAAEFQRALETGTNVIELTLTTDDLNALISTQPQLKDKLLVRIDNDQVRGDISMPLSNLGPLKLGGRYLNGSVIFQVVLTNGVLDVRLHDVQVKNKPLPPLVLNELKKNNLAMEFQKDPKAASDIAKYDTIQITNGAVVLRNRLVPRVNIERPGEAQ